MCGIVALFSALPSAAPVSRDELLAIRDRMTARGPDGAGLWMAEDGRVGLGHRRLAIIDPDPRSNQPMADASGRFVITFNGEIYNFADLRGDLESQGVTFRTASDTEVLLELFARQGPAMAGRLAGMFALAIWDKVERRLTLMRDAFGIKPLYYALEGGVLRVASSVKALMAGGGLPRDPDPAGHAGFFVFGHLPEPHTLYRAVRALEPGTWFSLDADGTEKRGRFFSIRDRLMAPPPSSPPPDLRQALNESIDRHFVADVPVGVFLSAGRDSATVTALASERQGAGLQTLTLGFDVYEGTVRDEVALAEQVAASYGSDHWISRAGPKDFQTLWPDLIEAMDQPSIDGSNVYMVARAARERGLKVALSGLGADELFGGYDTFVRAPALHERFGWVAPPIGRLTRCLTAPWLGGLMHPKAAGLLEQAATLEGAWLLRRALYLPFEVAGPLGKTIDRALGEGAARDGLAALALDDRLADAVRGIAEPERRVQALELGFYMQNQLLRDADWAGMGVGLEIRVPFVDLLLFNRLSPWCLRSPALTKDAMARTPVKPLPDAILSRRKTGFDVPIDRWLAGEDGGKVSEPGLRPHARRVYSAFTTSAIQYE